MKKQSSFLEKYSSIGLYLVIGLFLLLVLFVIYGYTGYTVYGPEQGYKDISAMQARNLIYYFPELIVIDVSPLYWQGHIPRAISAPLEDGTLDRIIPNLDSEGIYLVYCHFESASRTAAQKLTDAGFERVYRLEGEFDSWINEGYPIEL